VDRTGIPKDILSESSPVSAKPLVVIMNHATASAAEMLAGALHDNHRATLIGTRTFGQGLIHSLQPLSDGSGLIVAVARFETPNGMEIHHRGILPDYEVEEKERDLGSQKADPQYRMAVRVLLEKIAAKKES
jgi:carboxyl-terminal processing protease